MPLVAQHQFVAILRAQGWRAGLIGTWTDSGMGEAVAPDWGRVRWRAPRHSDDRNEKGTWSSVWLEAVDAVHPDVVTAAGVAALGDDELTGPLGPQGRYRRRGLEILLRREGLEALEVDGAWLVAGAHRIHLASGAVAGPDGAVRPRDAGLAPSRASRIPASAGSSRRRAGAHARAERHRWRRGSRLLRSTRP